MREEQLAKVNYQRAHGFGWKVPNKQRPIVAHLTHYKKNVAVMER